MDNEPAVDADSLQKQLNAGAGSLILLSRLVAAGRPKYGYELAAELDDAAGPLPMAAGSLYPVLRSLEKRGYLRSETRLSEEGRARRYYEPTDAGRAALPAWRQAWRETVRFVDACVNTPEPETTDEIRRRKGGGGRTVSGGSGGGPRRVPGGRTRAGD